MATAILPCFAWKGSSVPFTKLKILFLAVSPRTPNFIATAPASRPIKNNMAKYFTGTRPMNITNMHVAKRSNAVDKFVNAINPQITPHQINSGINASFISSIFCCFFESILAKLMISAKLAKSEGWKDVLMMGSVIHRAASLMDVPLVNV